MDADLSHDPEEIIILLEKIIKSKCDLVIEADMQMKVK